VVSDIFSSADKIEYILSEVEKFGEGCGLSASDAAKLRLLAEEMLGLTVRLFNNLDYEFFVENEEQKFTLSLSAKTLVSFDQKDKMLSLSSRGENQARKGVLGKLSGVFEDLVIGSSDLNHITVPYYAGAGAIAYFSMAAYQYELPAKVREEQWDGLEKSIIVNLAGDVVIGVKNNKVEMIAMIDF